MMEFSLERFKSAQEEAYGRALQEIRAGRKQSHWMWYIFPQVRGLGRSATSQYYAIQNLEEAISFLEDPYLGKNLYQVCEVLMQLDSNDATAVFGKIDDKKLRSSMTLFAYASGKHSVFHEVLDKFFDGRFDNKTKQILNLD